MADEWEFLGIEDEVYRECKHTCGTVVLVLEGCEAVCPKCQPEQYAKLKTKDLDR
jgi:hypothetical protein